MAEIINLRRVRKAKDATAARTLAAENAAKHGRTKARRAQEKAEAEKAARDLDALKRE